MLPCGLHMNTGVHAIDTLHAGGAGGRSAFVIVNNTKRIEIKMEVSDME